MLIEKIKEIVGSDILQVFGPSGAGKSKLVLYLSQEAMKAGQGVIFLDTERNLNSHEYALLGKVYHYDPRISGISEFLAKLPKADLFIFDSIGFPILVHFAKLSLRGRGDALLCMIDWVGTIKEWCYQHNALAIITNQPESEMSRVQAGRDRPEPFGDKSIYAAKEVWGILPEHRSARETISNLTVYRSRLFGQGQHLAKIVISKEVRVDWLFEIPAPKPKMKEEMPAPKPAKVEELKLLNP